MKKLNFSHNGLFSSLETAVRHQLDPVESAGNYDPSAHLPRIYMELSRPEQTETIASLAKPAEISPINLNDSEVREILAFLRSLTSPKLKTLAAIRPVAVPSGLEVD